MTLETYQKLFADNLAVMSRTAQGILDTSASATKKDSMMVNSGEEARNLVLDNTKDVVSFLYDNKDCAFSSADDLGDFIIQIAMKTNKGIVKPDLLFRNGEDSKKYNYVRIKDIPEVWAWFTKTLLWLINSDVYETYEVAAFCEYIINILGHFFSDGCGKTSMLVALYIFMRADLPCAKYVSRDEFYKIAVGCPIPTPDDVAHVFTDEFALNFFSYYGSLCHRELGTLEIYNKEASPKNFVIYLDGEVNDTTCQKLRYYMMDFYTDHSDSAVVFEMKKLDMLCSAGAKYFAELNAENKDVRFTGAKYDCAISLMICGLDPLMDKVPNIPEIDVTGCKLLGAGANGAVYKINNEVIAKTFLKENVSDDMMRERALLKNALLAGVEAPFSFGYAKIDGKFALLMELINSSSLMDRIRTKKALSAEENRDYVALVKSIHSIHNEEILDIFPQKTYEEDVLTKADRLDNFVSEKYKGLARKLIEKIDEPDCLIHGDIQPGNVMFGNDEMIFIDFDTFSVGREIFDLGALYHSIFGDFISTSNAEETYIKLPIELCSKMWKDFEEEYYKGYSRAYVDKKRKYILLIAAIRHSHLEMKRKISKERIDESIKLVEKCIDNIIS